MVWRKEIHIAGRDAEERPLQLEAITLKRGDSLAALRGDGEREFDVSGVANARNIAVMGECRYRRLTEDPVVEAHDQGEAEIDQSN